MAKSADQGKLTPQQIRDQGAKIASAPTELWKLLAIRDARRTRRT